jgi:predicted Zn-dependent protease
MPQFMTLRAVRVSMDNAARLGVRQPSDALTFACFRIVIPARFRFAGDMKHFIQSISCRTLLALVVAAGFTALFSGCGTVPVTGRSQLNLMSSGEEMQLGLSAFEETKKQVPVSKDAQLNAMVQRVGQRIAAVASKDMPEAQWEFVVFESKDANAFCLPGGKVGIYTGILPITKDEAGLATVMGHEIAHAVARHGGERMSQAMVIQGGGNLLGLGLQNTDPRWQAAASLAYGVGTKLGAELPHSRAQESEADRIGLTYMAQAGYPPEAAVDFWKRFGEFNKQQGGDTPWFLRTHPLDETRVKQLQGWIPEAKAKAASGAPK